MNVGQQYYSSKIFHSEMRGVIGESWHIVGHGSQWSRAGDFKLFCLGTEELVVIKSINGFNAVVNVCAHRGSRIITRQSGNIDRLVCPYHSWSYSLDGKLLDSRSLCGERGYSRDVRLARAIVKEIFGFVVVSFSDTEHELEHAISGLSRVFSSFEIENLRTAFSQNYSARANWKVFVANFLECYHCFPNHPQLRDCEEFIETLESGNTFTVAKTMRKAFETLFSAGVIVEPEKLDPQVKLFCTLNAGKLSDGKATETRTGAMVGKIINRRDSYSGVIIYGCIGPFIHFTLNPDHLVVFRFNPTSAEETQVNVSWYTHRESIPEGDQLEDMLWLWSNTIVQDIELTERVQSSVRSQYFSESRISRLEAETGLFEQWCSVHA